MRPHPWEEPLGGALAATVFLKLARNQFCNPGWIGAQFSLVAGQQLLPARLRAATSFPSAAKAWLARAGSSTKGVVLEIRPPRLPVM